MGVPGEEGVCVVVVDGSAFEPSPVGDDAPALFPAAVDPLFDPLPRLAKMMTNRTMAANAATAILPLCESDEPAVLGGAVGPVG